MTGGTRLHAGDKSVDCFSVPLFFRRQHNPPALPHGHDEWGLRIERIVACIQPNDIVRLWQYSLVVMGHLNGVEFFQAGK